MVVVVVVFVVVAVVVVDAVTVALKTTPLFISRPLGKILNSNL